MAPTNQRGFGMIELLIVAVVVLAVGVLYMKNRERQAAAFTKASGIKVEDPKQIEDAVQKALKNTADEQERKIQEMLPASN